MNRGTADAAWRRLLRGPRGDEPVVETFETPEPAGLEVATCALFDAGGGTSLLRVSGRWTPASPVRVELFVTTGESSELATALPPGADVTEDGLWSAAFPVEADERARFALVTPLTGVVSLPEPDRIAPPAVPDGELTAERDARVAAEQRLEHALEDLADAQAVTSQLRRRCTLSERGLAEFREKLVQAWGEAGEMRELLDERERAHEAAKERARSAHQIVEEVERRALDSQAELDARRQELEEHCAALTEQLDRRTNGELSAREDASEERAQAAAALERFTTARAEADALGAELAQARSAAEEASAASARAANDLDAERTARAEASNQADVYGERLAKSEREVTEARAELAGAEQQLEQTRAALAAATERLAEIESAAAEASAAKDEAAQQAEVYSEHLANSEQEVIEARAQATAALERFNAAQAETDALGAELAGAKAAAEELEQTQAALAAATERLAEIESATKTLAVSEQKTRQELELLTRPDQGDGTRRPFGRSKVSAQAYKDALARIEATEAERTRAEDDAARLADRVRELESEIAAHHADPTPAEVEGDLRHLLAARQRELDEVRRELTEQRARYAAVASTMTPTELAATAEPPAGEPWTALDDDLLGRLARAKELSGSD